MLFGRVSSSTSAALVALLHTITQALETNPYVVVVVLDFSKAFDTVRHSSVMENVAQLNLPNVYNWLINFLRDTATVRDLTGIRRRYSVLLLGRPCTLSMQRTYILLCRATA